MKAKFPTTTTTKATTCYKDLDFKVIRIRMTINEGGGN
jgi:hypothetical protein